VIRISQKQTSILYKSHTSFSDFRTCVINIVLRVNIVASTNRVSPILMSPSLILLFPLQCATQKNYKTHTSSEITPRGRLHKTYWTHRCLHNYAKRNCSLVYSQLGLLVGFITLRPFAFNAALLLFLHHLPNHATPGKHRTSTSHLPLQAIYNNIRTSNECACW